MMFKRPLIAVAFSLFLAATSSIAYAETTAPSAVPVAVSSADPVLGIALLDSKVVWGEKGDLTEFITIVNKSTLAREVVWGVEFFKKTGERVADTPTLITPQVGKFRLIPNEPQVLIRPLPAPAYLSGAYLARPVVLDSATGAVIARGAGSSVEFHADENSSIVSCDIAGKTYKSGSAPMTDPQFPPFISCVIAYKAQGTSTPAFIFDMNISGAREFSDKIFSQSVSSVVGKKGEMTAMVDTSKIPTLTGGKYVLTFSLRQKTGPARLAASPLEIPISVSGSYASFSALDIVQNTYKKGDTAAVNVTLNAHDLPLGTKVAVMLSDRAGVCATNAVSTDEMRGSIPLTLTRNCTALSLVAQVIAGGSIVLTSRTLDFSEPVRALPRDTTASAKHHKLPSWVLFASVLLLLASALYIAFSKGGWRSVAKGIAPMSVLFLGLMFFTAPHSAHAAAVVTQFTVNGGVDIYVNQGDSLHYEWDSSGADSWTSSWSGSGSCSFTGAGSWIIDSSSGPGYHENWDQAQPGQAGCTYTLTFTPWSGGIAGVPSQIYVTVYPLFASLTAPLGAHNFNATWGQSFVYDWDSSGGSTYSATYDLTPIAVGGAGACMWNGWLGGIPGPWAGGNSKSGSLNVVAGAPGCTLQIHYTVTPSLGSPVTDTVTMSTYEAPCGYDFGGTHYNSIPSAPGGFNGVSVDGTMVRSGGGPVLPLTTTACGSTPGACGTANGKTYPNGTPGYGADTQCAPGNSTDTSFPAAGNTVNWVCNSTNGGAPSGNCSASQAPASGGAPNCTFTFNGATTLVNVDPMVSRTWAWTSANMNTYSLSSVVSGCETAASNGTTNPWQPWLAPGTGNAAAGSNTGIPGNTRYGCRGITTYTVTNSGGASKTCTTDITFVGSGGVPINGICAATHNNCTQGNSANPTSDALNWYWNCNGINGGTNASCSESKVGGGAPGICAATHNNCAQGTSVNPTSDANYWYWGCNGISGGANVSCQESKGASVNGVCAATHFNCSAGTSASQVTGGSSWTWRCLGSGGGSDSPLCSEPFTGGVVNGACGPSSGQSFASAPVAGLCNAGSATAVVPVPGGWNWNCNGSGGGTNALCVAVNSGGWNPVGEFVFATGTPYLGFPCSAWGWTVMPQSPASCNLQTMLVEGTVDAAGNLTSGQWLGTTQASSWQGMACGGEPISHAAQLSAGWAGNHGWSYILDPINYPRMYDGNTHILRSYGYNPAAGTWSELSGNTKAVACIPASPPPVPTGLSATPRACGSQRIDLAWNASPGATVYTLTDFGILLANTGATTLTLNGLAPGSAHSFQVKASAGAASSAYSPAVNVNAPSNCGGVDLTAGPVSPNAATAGVPISLQALIINNSVFNGTGATPYTNLLEYSLNCDPTFGGCPAPLDLATVAGTPIGVKLSALSVFNNVTFPAAGDYYVSACADKTTAAMAPPGSIVESDDMNNCGPWSKVVVSPLAYSCTGVIPTNASAYGADESTGLAVDTPWSYAAADTDPNPKCQYGCNPGYTWSGGTCNPPPVPVVTVTVTPDINPVNPLIENVPNGGVWKVDMNSSASATACEYSRSGTYAGNWAGVPLGVSYTTGNQSWAGPGNVTYSFRCQNAVGQWSGWVSGTVNISAAAPVISVTPAAYDFGTALIGTTPTTNFTVSNTGPAITTLNVNPVALAGSPDFTCVANCGALTIPGGTSQIIKIQFAPVFPTGLKTANMTFASNDPVTPVVSLTPGVQGVASLPVLLVPTPLDFGSLVVVNGNSKTKSLTITNAGPTTVDAGDLQMPPAFSAPLTPVPFTCLSASNGSSPCAFNGVAPGASVTYTIRFAPTATGTYIGDFACLSSYCAQSQVEFKGVGLPPNFNVKEQ